MDVAYTYDPDGNRIAKTDNIASTTTKYLVDTQNPSTSYYSYNTHGQVTNMTDGLGNSTNNIYVSNGNLTSTSAGDQMTMFEYFNDGSLKKQYILDDPDGCATEYVYDGRVRPTTVTE